MAITTQIWIVLTLDGVSALVPCVSQLISCGAHALERPGCVDALTVRAELRSLETFVPVITLHAVFVVVVARLADALEASDRISATSVHADTRNRLTFIFVKAVAIVCQLKAAVALAAKRSDCIRTSSVATDSRLLPALVDVYAGVSIQIESVTVGTRAAEASGDVEAPSVLAPTWLLTTFVHI